MSSIADILINSGLSREQLDECRKLAGSSGETLDRVILQKGYLPEDDLLQSYGRALGFEFLAELEGTSVPMDFVNQVPVHFARSYNLVALDAGSNGVMRVATCNPLDPHPMDDLSAMLGLELAASSSSSSPRAQAHLEALSSKKQDWYFSVKTKKETTIFMKFRENRGSRNYVI